MTKLPTLPIIDGMVKCPVIAGALLLRIIEGGMKQTGTYENGAEIEVSPGTVLELLGSGNIVLMTAECVDPVAEPESPPEYPETDSAEAVVDRKPLVERIRIFADTVFEKSWDELTDEQKSDCIVYAEPTRGDFLPARGQLVMLSEFDASKSPMLKEIEVVLGFRDPKDLFANAKIPAQEDFPDLRNSRGEDVVITNPPGELIPEPEYDAKAIVMEVEDTPLCTSDDSCTVSDDACTSDDSCTVSDNDGLNDEADAG